MYNTYAPLGKQCPSTFEIILRWCQLRASLPCLAALPPAARATLDGIARHYKTGEPLPEDLFQKLTASKNFRAASMMMRQVGWP